MKTRRDILKLSVAASASIFATGCGMDGATATSSDASPSASSLQQSTAASLTESDTQLGSQSKGFNLTFNEPIDTTLFTGENIKLKDQSGYVSEDSYVVRLNYADSTYKTVNIDFADDFRLKSSWKYTVEIQPSAWFDAASSHYIDFVTAAISPFENLSSGVSGSNVSLAADAAAPQRTQIIVISDIHMNDDRALLGYGWFFENSALFTEFLQYVRDSQTVAQLVIAGDLFDNWVVPLNLEPYQDGVTDDLGYFQSVAYNPINSESVAMINQIADAGNIKVVYVPGNHDMLFTEDICSTIFPNVVWAGGSTSGWGKYEIGNDIVIEHGHRFDFNNAPMDPSYSYQGSLIPPGYFIARLAATDIAGYMKWYSDTHSIWDDIGEGFESFGDTVGVMVNNITGYTSKTFIWSYYIAMDHIIPAEFNSAPFTYYYAQCNGLGGFSGDYKLQDAGTGYSDAQIDSLWYHRQLRNGLTGDYQLEAQAIANGTGWNNWGDLYNSSIREYYPNKKVIVVGHTHGAKIKYNSISGVLFANSGTWIDQDLVNSQAGSSFQTATYICVDSADHNGSDVHAVTLYKYEGSGDSTNLASASIDASS